MHSSTSTSLKYPSTNIDNTAITTAHLPSPRDLRIRNNHHHHRRTLSSTETQGVGASRNSSLQKVWAEDYYESEDNEGEKAFDSEHYRIPSTHSDTNALPSTGDIQGESLPKRPTRTHQRSLTSLLPFRNSTSRSPERKYTSPLQVDFFMPTLTGDKDGVINVADKSKRGMASWFSGTSAPVPVGIPAIDPETTPDFSPTIMASRDSSPERNKLKKKLTIPIPENQVPSSKTTTRTNTSANSSRFSGFFSATKTSTKFTNMIQLPASQVENDELLGDLLSALYPGQGVEETFSPAAYKNLQMTAEGTILKLQNAYRRSLSSIHEIRSDRDTCLEEKEDLELQVQIYDRKVEAFRLVEAAQKQELEKKNDMLQELEEQLAAEKQARAEEKETREKSINLLKAQASFHDSLEHKARSEHKHSRMTNQSIDSTNEDLGISTARSNRDSRASDMSERSNLDYDESIFTDRSDTPALQTTRSSSMTSMSVSESVPEIGQASLARVVPNPSQSPTLNTPAFLPPPKEVQQKSTFQKLLSGMSNAPGSPLGSASGARDMYEDVGMGLETCSNCRGQTASVAWDSVGMMRAENMGLKERVVELEDACDASVKMLRRILAGDDA